MYKRPKIEDYIHDPDRNGSDGCSIVFYQDEEEEYLEALEKYCDFLESIGGTPVLLRAREEEIEELSRCVKAYDNDLVDAKHALFMAIEDATEDSVSWKKHVDKRNARDLYEVCKLYYADINTSNREIKTMVLFYNLLAQEESNDDSNR